MSSITEDEQRKFWDIFQGLSPQDGFLTGEQAVAVLGNSGLREDQLEKVWDLSDLDSDGRLDFEEFCVSMKLVFDVLQGKRSALPERLPLELVPSSKMHLVAANDALERGIDVERPESPDYGARAEGLKEGFDWYMSPADRRNYEAIYTANADRRGGVKFDRLTELYQSLADNVPRSEIDRAWQLVNPKLQEAVGKDQLLAYLHCLNQRHQGYRIPKTVPASLRATFQKTEIDYNASKYGKDGKLRSSTSSASTATDGKESGFGGKYLDKLGVSRSGRNTDRPLYDSSDVKDGDWEVVRLKRELADLDAQIDSAQRASDERQSADGVRSQAGVVRRELEQLLDFKKSELERLDSVGRGGNAGGDGAGLQSIRDDIDMYRQQVDQLEAHLKQRQSVLSGLERERSTIST